MLIQTSSSPIQNMVDNYSKEKEITEELKQEEAKNAEKRFDLLLNATNEGVWEADLINNSVWWNDTYHKKFGRPENTNDSWEWWVERIHIEDRKRVKESLLTVASSGAEYGNHWNEEYAFRLPDNTYVNIDDRAYIMRDQNNKATRVIGIMLDITKQKSQELELRKYSTKLAHASRINILGEMATNITHELNQPLTAISLHADSCIDLLESNENSNKDYKEAFKEIKANAVRGKKIIQQAREFIKETKDNEINISINELITNTIKFFRFNNHERFIDIKTDLSNEDTYVVVDKIQLEQVLINLLQNAIEAINTDTDSNILTFSTKRINDNEIQIMLADSGRGITKGNEKKIFEPFYSSKTSGLGVGLSISKRIIENYQGKMWAENGVCKGAVLNFTLPVTN